MKKRWRRFTDRIKIAANLIQWPVWYLYGTLPVLFLMGIEVLGSWVGFAYPFMGVMIVAWRKIRS